MAFRNAMLGKFTSTHAVRIFPIRPQAEPRSISLRRIDDKHDSAVFLTGKENGGGEEDIVGLS